MNKDKAFDCVEMQHLGAELIKKKIDSMTVEEQLEYWRKGTEEFKERQQKLRNTRDTDETP
jgi:hypothetical protein